MVKRVGVVPAQRERARVSSQTAKFEEQAESLLKNFMRDAECHRDHDKVHENMQKCSLVKFILLRSHLVLFIFLTI